MSPYDAMCLVNEIKKIDQRKRETRPAKADWDFINLIWDWAKKGKTLIPKRSFRLQEAYRRAAGHYNRLFTKVI